MNQEEMDRAVGDLFTEFGFVTAAICTRKNGSADGHSGIVQFAMPCSVEEAIAAGGCLMPALLSPV